MNFLQSITNKKNGEIKHMDKLEKEETIVIHTMNGTENISIEDYPKVINNAVTQIKELDKKYNHAKASVQKAKTDAERVAKIADYAKTMALETKKKADKVKNEKVGLFNKKESIESLQKGHVELADTQCGVSDTVQRVSDVQSSMVEAQNDTMDALKFSIDFNKEITNITKYLFLLGCSSMAASQTVCRTLEMKLRDASEEELSEMARQELKNVVDNLKSQENIMRRQKQFECDLDIYISKTDKNIDRLDEHDKALEIHTDQISKHIKKNIEYDKRLNREEEKDIEQDKKIADSILKNKEHDEAIKALALKMGEQDKRLEVYEKENAGQRLLECKVFVPY